MAVRRPLFTAPGRPRKRRRMTGPARRRIPRSLLPEMKQYRKNSMSNSQLLASPSHISSSIGVDLSQGTQGQQFVGSKFRAVRLRCHYDFTAATASQIRIFCLIAKNPSDDITVSPITNAKNQLSSDDYTVLFDRFIPNGENVNVGSFDVPMRIHVEMNNAGTLVRRNDIRLYAIADGVGTLAVNQMTYSLWFTDA